MIALAGNFYIFAPRITTRLAAVLLAVRNIAAAWNVRACLFLLISHRNSSERHCSEFSILCQVPGQTCRRSASPFSGSSALSAAQANDCNSAVSVETLVLLAIQLLTIACRLAIRA